MRKMIKGFGDFINKGNVLTIAIGLVMALSIGLVIDAVISFVVVAFFLFLVVEAYNRMRPATPDVSAVTEVGLLIEIRDLLAERQQ